MQPLPHPDSAPMRVGCAVLTVSDTRSQATDHSGQLLQTLLTEAGHRVVDYAILRDEPAQIQTYLAAVLERADLDVVICNGGTGIAPRDTTFDAIAALLDKDLPGFGELFRMLSYSEIGSRAMASRATAGVSQGRLIFVLPGSTHAVQMATKKLILPELNHLLHQLGRW
ncbi:molybdenum cofactor biosynthesis protein [Synechococcales cyanobacterium C]|uniref:Molybdenum cofactor biosynthesis protein B n=1 Tax=Petrachloros mirabilis ULC683 TaxID=2781853 RepID=A0A8K2A2J2_9CYAN|nr:molybdenum cofactor biosynthesis protein B [Petrachloros mirabilis]NCJ08633.1 molybdenum cofactor biosynthesis protein [Petrachloros mirabilis ULC683]